MGTELKNSLCYFIHAIELLAHNYFHCYVMKDPKFG